MNNYNEGGPPFEADFQKIGKELKKNLKFVVIFGVVGLAVLAGFTSYVIVQPTEQAVILRFGKYVETVGRGLHLKLPFGVDRAFKFETEKIQEEQFGYREIEKGRFGGRTRRVFSPRAMEELKKESSMVTGDLNVADVNWYVSYRVSDLRKYFFNVKDPIKNIRDISESIMRRVVGDRLVTDVLTTGKQEISIQAQDLIQEVLDRYDMGIQIVKLEMQDVFPPEVVKSSWNEVEEARQEKEKAVNNAEKEYNKVIPEARGKAKKLVSEAEGYSDKIVNRALGDANKFLAVLAEYNRAPEITKKRLYLETMERIYSRFENVTIVDSKIQGLLPIFQKGGSGLLNSKQE